MVKKIRFYAVVHGRQTGIFDKWNGGAREAVERFNGALHRAFSSLELAEEWYRQNSHTPKSAHSAVYHFDTATAAIKPVESFRQIPFEGTGARKFAVYFIIDPHSDEPFYVGETGNLIRRQSAHLKSATNKGKRASAKIAQILASGQQPVFKIVEWVETKEAALAAESRRIKECVGQGYTVWNRTREHREISEIFQAAKVQMDRVIGDGPIQLGTHSYTSRFEFKTKLFYYLSKQPFGRLTHPVAVEKLGLLWDTTKSGTGALEFWLVPTDKGHALEVLDSYYQRVRFNYPIAIDRIS
ncbi:ribonuclease H1 domain-containing protein [Stutzerimonas chloritidismutans]|uniref:ribonuclease H1 domain-containing protein n=1 Tax=Stutzerimonas chloritidismutans TaxID=203192 RepID=UPI003F140D36